MIERIAISSVVAVLMLCAPSVARANSHGDDGDKKGDHDDHRRAPEPATIIGLGLGAAAIVGARWKLRRSTRRQ